MKKPEKFDDFIDAIMKEACKISLTKVCNNCGISSRVMDECENWLEKLQEVITIEEDK